MAQLLLWERVDATSFVQETYEKYLTIGRKLQLQQQQEPQHHHNQELTSRMLSSVNSGKKHKKQKKKNKKITDPAKWAQIQTGLALGNVLRSRTSCTTAAEKTAMIPSVQIRSLIIRNIGQRLDATHLDDFLPTSIVSSAYLRELTLTQFETLTDTHVHVLLLTTTFGYTTSNGQYHNNNHSRNTSIDNSRNSLSNNNNHNCNLFQSRMKLPQTEMKPRIGYRKISATLQQNQLVTLHLEYCSKLTNRSLTSIANTCSCEHLRQLSLRGCAKITAIDALADFFVTQLNIRPVASSSSSSSSLSSSLNGKLATAGGKETHPSKKSRGSTVPPPTSMVQSPPRVAALHHHATIVPRTNTNCNKKNTDVGLASLFAPPVFSSLLAATVVPEESSKHSSTKESYTSAVPVKPCTSSPEELPTQFITSLFSPPLTKPREVSSSASVKVSTADDGCIRICGGAIREGLTSLFDSLPASPSQPNNLYSATSAGTNFSVTTASTKSYRSRFQGIESPPPIQLTSKCRTSQPLSNKEAHIMSLSPLLVPSPPSSPKKKHPSDDGHGTAWLSSLENYPFQQKPSHRTHQE